MANFTDNYGLTLPEQTDIIDINVFNNNFTQIDDAIHTLATASDRVTGNTNASDSDQWMWRTRAWANGNVEIWGVKTFNMAKSGVQEITVRLPANYVLATPYYLDSSVTYVGPWTSILNNKNNFATKFKSAPPAISCTPFEQAPNKFMLRVFNQVKEATQLNVNIHIIGSVSNQAL